MKPRNSLRVVAVAGLILASVGIGATSAAATGKDGWLTDGELGLFCYKDQTSSVFDLYGSDSNFADDYFKGTKSCAHQLTDNYTESWSNRDTYNWSVHTEWKGAGYTTSLPAGSRGNFNSMFSNTITSAYFF